MNKEDIIKRYNRKHVIRPDVCKIQGCMNKIFEGSKFCYYHTEPKNRFKPRIDIEIYGVEKKNE